MTIKLIIWDLDGIIWSNSLAESGGIGLVHTDVVDFIKKTEANGIIHSLCSKNNFLDAKLQLEKIGLWDLFVFPKIQFTSKGQLVKDIIQSCQLREENVLFVDDNNINLNEVKFYCPKINVSVNVDFLQSFTMPYGKSRTDLYRVLETKSVEKTNKSNLEFLKDSDINIVLYRCQGLANGMEYFERVYELVERSNQLNFTKSRLFLPEDMPYASFQNSEKYYVFVWDKYGYYGLVGYFASDETVNFTETTHFVFSCRILNMNIENFCSRFIKEKLGWLQKYHVSNDGDYSFIKLHTYDAQVNYIRQQESLEKIQSNPQVAIYAGCNDGIIMGFSKMDYIMESISFNLMATTKKKLIIFSLATFLSENQSLNIEQFVARVKQNNQKVLFLAPNGLASVDTTVSKLCSLCDNEHFFQLNIPITTDYMHWDRITIHNISKQIKDWILTHLVIDL